MERVLRALPRLPMVLGRFAPLAVMGGSVQVDADRNVVGGFVGGAQVLVDGD